MARTEDWIDRHLFRKCNFFQCDIKLLKIRGCSRLTRGNWLYDRTNDAKCAEQIRHKKERNLDGNACGDKQR